MKRARAAAPLAAAGAVALLATGSTLPAQEPEVVRQTRISHPGASQPLVEPMLGVDPRDGAHLIVGAIVAPVEAGDPWHCAAFTTLDAGGSWSRWDFPMERCIDPWIVFLRGGDVLFTGIELSEDAEGGDRFHLVAYRSTDGGRTWSPEANSLGRGYDHELLRTRVAPSGDEELLLAARRMGTDALGQPRHWIAIERSRDGGRSFRPVAEIRPSNGAMNATGLEVLADGLPVVSYWEFQRDVDGFDRRGMLERARAAVVRLEPSGPSIPLLITDSCASGIEGAFPGYPWLVADVGRGQGADRLYHACVRPALDGIAISRSTDGGRRWSEPVVLRPAAASSHPGSTSTPAHSRTPMLAVNPDGMLLAAWYDRAHDPERACQHVHVAGSVDGGASFAAPLRLTDAESCPENEANGRAGRSWPMGGDYSSIAAGPEGLFHVAWADARAGRFALRYAAVRVRPGGR